MADLASDLKGIFKGKLFNATDAFWHTDFLRTDIPAIDTALGGGVGYGRVSELYGNWSSGKTLLLYRLLANNQKAGGKSILFEAEGAFSPDFYAALGGDPDTLLVYAADTVEEVFDGVVSVCGLMAKYAKAGNATPVAIGWDGIAATGTKHLQEVGMDKRDMSKANAMSTGCQLVRGHIKECRVAFIATNQTRDKIGSNDSQTHTPGGVSFPFLASQRIELMFDGGTKSSLIYARKAEGEGEIGRWVRGKVVKNKLGPPFGQFMLPIYVHEGFLHPEWEYKTKLGIDETEALFYMYLRGTWTPPSRKPVIENIGAWYKFSEELFPNAKKFQKVDWLEVLAEYPQLRTLPYAAPIKTVEDTAKC